MSEVVVFTTRDIAVRCGVDVTFVEELVQLGVISIQPGTERAFPAEVTLRVGRFVRLQRDLGVNREGAAVIVDLLDRIEALEHRLAQLERR
jgi:MerR-like DNA binding protein